MQNCRQAALNLAKRPNPHSGPMQGRAALRHCPLHAAMRPIADRPMAHPCRPARRTLSSRRHLRMASLSKACGESKL